MATAQHIKDRVFVLYGALRSGTTLMRLLLDSHPEISCPGERDFMLDHLQDDGGNLVLNEEALSRDRVFRDSGLSHPADRRGQEAFNALLDQELQQSKRALILIIHRRPEWFQRVMPGVRIIHLVRDPRDVARSSIGMGWAGNTWYGVDHWLKTEHNWDRHAPAQVHTLRYEDMLADPETRLTGLCRFMGLDYDPAMMRYSERSSYDTLDPSLCYQWKHKQSAREIAHVEHKAGALLTARGYALSGNPVHAPGPFGRARLWVQNKSHIWRIRFRRYGYLDPILVFAGRRLGLKSLANAAQARIDVKTLQFLE